MVDIFYRKYCRWYNCYYEKIGSNIKNISDEIPFEIPSTWSWQRIKAICEIKGGKRIPKGMTFQKEKTDHIYIRVTDMKDETISEDNLVYISDSIFNLIKNYTVSKEDLYVTVAGTIGRCGNVPDNFDGMNLTENADKLTNLIVNKEWVLTVLTSKYAIDAMNYKAHQVAQPKLSIETLGNIFIPIPPKNEIRKILSIIKDSKALLSNLDKEIISLEDIVNQTKQKILEHFFGENSCYKSYYQHEKDELQNICKKITKGSTPTTYGFDFLDNGISFIKVENVKNHHIDNESITCYISDDANEFQKRSQLKENDVLFSIAGTIGRTCIVTKENLPANTNQAFAIISEYEKIKPKYLLYFLEYSKLSIDSHGGGMMNATLGGLKTLNIWYPISKNIQEKIIYKIENSFELLNTIIS